MNENFPLNQIHTEIRHCKSHILVVVNINEMITQLATQDINSIAKILPHNNEDVNILIVTEKSPNPNTMIVLLVDHL
jgi:hypothetical protein